MGNAQLKVYKADPGKIIKEMTEILKITKAEKRKRALAQLLTKSFRAQGCLVRSMIENAECDPEGRNLLVGTIPYHGRLTDEAKNAFIEDMARKAKRSLQEAKSGLDDITAVISSKVSDTRTLYVIAVLIERCDKPFAVVLLFKKEKPYGNNEAVFRHIRPHIYSVLAK